MAKAKTAEKVKIGNYLLEKLPSGSLRLRKMYKGETYSLIFDYKPTEKEITQALSTEMNKAHVKKERMTFKTAAEKYMDIKNSVLSPSTIRGYKSILRNLPDSFTKQLISDINSVSVQRMETVKVFL